MVKAGNQVEHCKDQFAADMSNCMAKEGQYNKFFVSLLEAQADYHQKALAVLGRALPGMWANQGRRVENQLWGLLWKNRGGSGWDLCHCFS